MTPVYEKCIIGQTDIPTVTLIGCRFICIVNELNRTVLIHTQNKVTSELVTGLLN